MAGSVEEGREPDARAGGDGLSATSFPSGIHGFPVEAIEANAPLVYESRRLRPDSGGPGKWRGGLGQEFVVRPRPGAHVRLAPFFDRTRYPARGLFGGRPGAPGRFELDGVEQHPKTTVDLPPGSRSVISMPGGGGYGDPAERDPAAIARDVADGLITPEHAREWYGFRS